MNVNNSNVSMLDSIIRIDDYIYLPISDMSIVYNIKINYIKDTNRVVIDKLNTGMIKATAVEDANIKFKPRSLSKNIGILKQGETVSCFYTTSKGWRQIRKDDGTVGYLKANKLGDEYIVRQDMQGDEEAFVINKKDYESGSFDIKNNSEEKKVVLKNIADENIKDNEEDNIKIWVQITDEILKGESKDILNDYKLRTNLIDIILKEAMEKNINGISIEFTGIEDKNDMQRFMIECAPKLREVGISTCIVVNKNIQKKDYINIVDYIVE